LVKKIRGNFIGKNKPADLIMYCGIVVLGMVFFYVYPALGLLLFIIISSYHFGNQHWKLQNNRSKKWISHLFQGVYGLLVFGILFSFHEQEVLAIIQTITRSSFSNLLFTEITVFSGLLLIILGVILASNDTSFRSLIGLNFFYIVVFTVLFYNAGLIWGFSMYFVLWHSIPSIQDQIKFLYGVENRTSWMTYIRSSILFWSIAVGGMVFAYIGIDNDTLFKAVFFSLMAAITFPHTLIIAWMQNTVQKKDPTPVRID
jgi:Brp/Blh family beta-carotene 15,15'-monooxygenase